MNNSLITHPGTVLLIGFDSAWTSNNHGAIVGLVRKRDGTFRELGLPQIANFTEAAAAICDWQRSECPEATIVLLDQPTIVRNAMGQRPVENLVSSPVGLRYGGIQPANTSRVEMFGRKAPVWQFVEQFGGAANPMRQIADSQVFETYPVLALIALGWVLPDKRVTGRLPKYNPERRKTFSIDDWRYVCKRLSDEIAARHLSGLTAWIKGLKTKRFPCKADQDRFDACMCLLVALYLVERKECLMVGDTDTGYILVPHRDGLLREIEERCKVTHRDPSLWLRTIKAAQQRHPADRQ
jgi:predicted RNase H-like nuclease